MIVRLNLLLAVALVLSSIWLIRTSHEARHLFVALDKAQTQSHELQLDFERLQVDKRAQATPFRVEKLARDKLHMNSASLLVTRHVSLAEGADVAPAPQASGVQP